MVRYLMRRAAAVLVVVLGCGTGAVSSSTQTSTSSSTSMCGQQCPGAVEGPAGAVDHTATLADGGVLTWRICSCVNPKPGAQPFVWLVDGREFVCEGQRQLWERVRAETCIN